MSASDRIKLSDSSTIPARAFGLYKIPGDKRGVNAILTAISVGYRHFDCASYYGNEATLGEAIKLSGIDRNQFFLASKVWNDAQKLGRKGVRDSVAESIRLMDCQYVDLMYIHWPVPEVFCNTYLELQALCNEGLIRHIGISNFGIEDYEKLEKVPEIKLLPAVNQIEVSPFMYRPDIIRHFVSRGIHVAASKALHRAVGFDDETVHRLIKVHQKTAAQIFLRWGLQKGLIVISKSISVERIQENFDILDFSLSRGEMESLDSLTSERAVREREELESVRKQSL